MEISDGRFYWWGISGLTEPHDKEHSNCLFLKYPHLKTEIQNFFGQTNSGQSFLLVNHSQLQSYFSKSQHERFVKTIFAVPMHILPGPVEGTTSSCDFDRVYGTVNIRKNLLDPNSKSIVTVASHRKAPFPKCDDHSFQWPIPKNALIPSSENSERKFVPFETFPPLDAGTNLFIARIPDSLPAVTPSILQYLKSAQSVWTSGIRTAKKLVQLGVAVSGTVESFGQRELTHPFIKRFFGDRWIKLTYQRPPPAAEHSSELMQEFGWYTLGEFQPTEEIQFKTHFYWMSSTQYLKAISLYPELRSKYHSSGVGNSFDFFSRHIEETHYQAFYSISDWRENIS